MTATIAAVTQLPAASRVQGYAKRLRFRAKLKDIYVNVQGLYNKTEQALPNAIYAQVEGTENVGNRQITVTFKRPLAGSVVTGNDRLLGNEVEPDTIAGTIYRNNYKFAVRTETYNTRALDQKPYGLFDAHIKELGDHARQQEGYEIREALLRRYPSDMIAGDLSGVITQHWNPHFFVQGATTTNQPAYDSTASDFVNNIVTSIVSVGGSLTQTQAGAATFRMLNKIALRALDKKLKPLQIGGEDAYILTISPLNASIYTDPNLTASHGAVWTSIAQLSEKIQNWYGVIGKFMTSIGVCIYVTVDPKLSTLLPAGTNPYTLTPGYVVAGDVDNRNYSNANTRDAGILHGKGALVKWEPEKMHMVKHEDDYGRILGTGYAGVRGIQMLTYDQTSPTDTSIEYYGSMVCIMNRWAY